MLDDLQSTALARALGAQIAVLGQVSYQPASPETGGTASAALRALNTESGELLAQLSATVRVDADGDQAEPGGSFAALAEQLSPQLATEVLAPFVAEDMSSVEITVQVLDVSSYSDLILIKDYLQDNPGVREISQIELQSGTGSFTLSLTGNPHELKSTLAAHDFGSFTTDTYAPNESLITLRIVKKR
jgi:hypothetical protein